MESRFYPSGDAYREYADNSLNRALEEGQITKDDYDLIKEFAAEVRATRNIGMSRAYRIIYTLVSARLYLGAYRDNSIADLYAGIDKIQTSYYKNNTKSDYIHFIKRFYLWLVENGYSTIAEKKIRNIRPPQADTMTKTPEMLLTEDEVKKMVEVCKTARDRALIMVLYEGGFRIGEVAQFRWGDIKFSDWNVSGTTNKKTGKFRTVPLIMSRPYLAQWKQDYPLEITPEMPVFLSNKKKPVQYAGLAKQIGLIAARAGITKHITPHIFRHTRVTELIRQGYGEAYVKKIIWGNLSSEMFSRYLHLVDADVERVAAEKAGIVIGDQKKQSVMEPRQCPRCYTINGPTHMFCGTCGLELTEEAVNRVRQIKEQAELQPEYNNTWKELEQKYT